MLDIGIIDESGKGARREGEKKKVPTGLFGNGGAVVASEVYSGGFSSR
jgi:hypothetical protein